MIWCLGWIRGSRKPQLYNDYSSVKAERQASSVDKNDGFLIQQKGESEQKININPSYKLNAGRLNVLNTRLHSRYFYSITVSHIFDWLLYNIAIRPFLQ